MTPKHFIAVGLRLFAIWLLIGAVQIFAIISALKRLNDALGGNSAWLGFAAIALFLAMAFFIWILSAPMATAVLSGVPRPQVTTLSLFDLVVVGCVLMGLWWLKESLVPFVALWLKALVAAPEASQSAFAWLGPVGKLNVLMYLAQIAISLFFVCRPYSIAKWVIRGVPVTHEQEVEGH